MSEHADDMPSIEDRQLKVGYFRMLTERWPFGRISESHNKENALFFAYEREYMRVPSELAYSTLEPSIAPEHRIRLQKLWHTLLLAQRQWEVIVRALSNKWDQIPHARDPKTIETAQRIVEETRVAIAERFRNAAIALITVEMDDESSQESGALSPLQLWQLEEESLRRDLYFADKEFLLMLRIYYEMLLEKYKNEKGEEQFVLPKDHPCRLDIVLRNRYLRLIDAAHQGISIEKAVHHEQDSRQKRLRKTRPIPYAMHPLGVLSAEIFDVIPHSIEKEHLGFDPALIGLLGPMHDTYEDTQYTIPGIMDVLKTRVDRLDTALFPILEDAASESREEVKRKVIDLMKENTRRHIAQALRVLSKNTVLSDLERKKALQQNIAGRKRTQTLLSIIPIELKKWRISGRAHETPKSKTFQRFSEPALEKFDGFLIRLNALTSGTRQQHALMVKLEDVAHNNASLAGMPHEHQRETLRATVSRLIAWCMFDHDNARFPLFNALPRLIDITLNEYERFANEFPDRIDGCDLQYKRQLTTWQREVIRLELPARVKEILAEYETSNT